MLLIPCPYCGPRAEVEFSYGFEAHRTRPKNPDKLSDADWAEYLFMNDNPKGVMLERWVHTHGCRRWFNMARNTVTYEVLGVYKTGERPPRLKKESYV